MSRRRPTKSTRLRLYSAARHLDLKTCIELGLLFPLDVYIQDPLVAENDPKFGFDDGFHVRWEPGIGDGPTSARFAVVDYEGDTGELIPKAVWDADACRFVGLDGKVLDRDNKETWQFHQVNVWALLQNALAFFEGGQGLGRPIPFGFEGNRLIVVPHAGYGRNAFYDRESKSLQFYYFQDDDGRMVYTCQSADIVNHEFGHAVLDGIRPYFFESVLVETAAFHELVGDLTAILILLRNNRFRGAIAEATDGDMAAAEALTHIAEQFGQAVEGNPYLRTALNTYKMSDMADEEGPHRMSEVLTGAMFDILQSLSTFYIEKRGRSPKQGFWDAIQRMHRMAVQPLDLLPPVDATFKDYALAVLRAEQLANPTDPHGFRDLMAGCFGAREILSPEEVEALSEPGYLYDRPTLTVLHDVEDIAHSRAAAYRFLDDNRDRLLIPHSQDVQVADLYTADKLTRQGARLPRQIILQYLWREDVRLEGEQFGDYEGEWTSLLCGGTLVFDDCANLLWWTRKPGTEGGDGKAWKEERAAGEERKGQFLAVLARRIQSGRVGAPLGSSRGLLGSSMPPLTVQKTDGRLRFALAPHLNLCGDVNDDFQGGPGWEVSS